MIGKQQQQQKALSILPACLNLHSIKHYIKYKFTKHNEDI